MKERLPKMDQCAKQELVPGAIDPLSLTRNEGVIRKFSFRPIGKGGMNGN
jgi:hypothetical protein